MHTSSGKWGPSSDTLKLLMNPYDDHITWSLMRVNHSGPTTRQGRVASGSVRIPGSVLHDLTARRILETVLGSLPLPAEQVGAPSGAMGGQQTLDLDFSA